MFTDPDEGIVQFKYSFAEVISWFCILQTFLCTLDSMKCGYISHD